MDRSTFERQVWTKFARRAYYVSGATFSMACASTPTSRETVAMVVADVADVAQLHTARGIEAFVAAATTPSCSSIPTLSDVQNGSWSYSDRLTTAHEAAQLGIPLVNAKGSASFMAMVRDYRRAKPCISADGNTLLYGQVIRAVIEISDYDASLGSNLAAIAASGTLNRKNQFFYLYKDGFFNSQIDAIISSVSGKAFDVENYATYQTVMVQMIGLLALPATTFSVNLLEVVPPPDNPFYPQASGVAYALDRLSNGKSCRDASQRFATNAVMTQYVSEVYQSLDARCDASPPGGISRLKAKSLLQGVQVK